MEMLEQVLCEHCDKPITDNPLVVGNVRGDDRYATEIDDMVQFFHQSAVECANAKPLRPTRSDAHRVFGVRLG